MNLCKELAREIKHQRLEASALQILAYTSNHLKQYEQAAQFLEQSLTLINPENYYSLSYQYNYQAESFFGLKQYREARQTYHTTLDYSQK